MRNLTGSGASVVYGVRHDKHTPQGSRRQRRRMGTGGRCLPDVLDRRRRMVAEVIVDRVTVAMADELGREARHGALLWMRYASDLVDDDARRRVASGIMLATVYEQAGLLGLVTCTRCGDVGCDWCRRALLGSSL